MASHLYECLYEAQLERYYPSFIAVGLQKIEQLAQITMKEYPKLGVHNMDDRKRLFQLIKIVQSVQEEEDEGEDDVISPLYEPGCVYLQPQPAKSGPCRQLKFDSFFVTNEGLGDCESTQRNPLAVYSSRHKDGMWQMATSHREVSLESSQDSNKAKKENGLTTCPPTDVDTKLTSPDFTPRLGESEPPVIQRVTHVSGYNYGVPHSCTRANNFDGDCAGTANDKIRVCVRKRPLGVREERRGETNVVTVEDKETLLIHEKKEAVDLKQYILQHVFYFDEVFSENLSNRDVYLRTAFPLIQHLFNGGHASCFAYGQTGAGKTYTMIGTPQNPGLYALAAKDIFQHLESSQPKRNLYAWISFYEIYCGQLYDLLNGRKRLFAREDGNHVVQIVGLREVQVDSVDLLLEVILKGSRERSTGATGVNSDSSRSHAIIQIQVKDAACRTFGRMSFIDLAGSERAADARESNKQTKFEGAEINQSLLALKECIRALDQEHAHTPFRQSKLTQVLKDSFIGNSKTCMIANISPSHVATEHTLNTLRYADRVKELKKGIKCCTTVTSRSRTNGSSSPKRLQNLSSVNQGEKNSPKKVKLGCQHPTNPSSGPSKLKAYPSVFHPTNIPLSSTPKTTNKVSTSKGNSSQPWLHRTTPVKGFLKAGKNSKKRSEGLAWHSDKGKGIHVGVTASDLADLDIGDNFFQNNHSIRAQKVQAVRPVQKQIVPRNRVSLPEDSSRDNMYHNDTSLKTERDHLRFYHQQFQQPPILQTKLTYQPLERFLAAYRPEEIRLQCDSDSQNPRSVLSEAGTQLEDLDDSDFSEDSVSYSSNQNKKKKQSKIDRKHPFYLHDKELGSMTDKGNVNRQPRFYKYGEQTREPRQSDGWVFTGDTDQSRNHCNWCIEDISPPLLQNNNMPEKPYSYQEDLACRDKNQKDSSPDYSQSIKNKWQFDTNGIPSLDETFSSSVSSVLDCKVSESKNRTNDGLVFMNETSCEQHEPVEGHGQKENERKKDSCCETEKVSAGSITGLMDPLSLSLLETEKTGAWENQPHRQGQETYLSVEQNTKAHDTSITPESMPCLKRNETVLSSDSMSEFIKQMLKYDKMENHQVDLDSKNELITQTLDNSVSSCSIAGSSPASTNHGSVHDEYLESLKSRTSPSFRDGFDASLTIDRESRECMNSRHYDADTEDTILKSPEKSLNFDISSIPPTKGPPETHFNPGAPIGGKDEDAHKSNGFSSSSHSLLKVTENQKCENCCKLNKNNITQSESTFKMSLPSEETGLDSKRTLPSKCLQDNSVSAGLESGCLDYKSNYSTSQNSPKRSTSKSSQTSICEILSSNERPLERARQLVVHAHRQQLEEITALGVKEESLLQQMSQSDFKDYVAKVDEIMLLKSRSIQSMRAQIQLYLAYPVATSAEDRTPTS